jgi:hypothetical protein
MKKTSTLLAKNFKSAFLSCERDTETIWRRLFVESRPYSDKLKRLLVVNTPDCLDESQQQYRQAIDKLTVKDMHDIGYIKTVPRFSFGEHEEVKSYIFLQFDDFTPTGNPEFRDCSVSLTVVCHMDCWEMDDYKLRPYQIAGYIDGILNETRLSGIGLLQFVGASQIVLDENMGGVVLLYKSTHHDGSDSEKVHPEWPAPQQL